MSVWGDGDEEMGTHNHENAPHVSQMWKLEFADRDENGTILEETLDEQDISFD